MFLKTLAVIIIFYLLVKFVSRLFLPSRGQKSSNFRVFYRLFKNMREQQKRQQHQQSANHSGSGNRRRKNNRFDEIEEAEFEEISEQKESDKDS